MSSSPTSSHTDYMPATSSATVVVAAVTPQQISSNIAESSSQSQEIDQNVIGEGSIQIVVTGGQQGIIEYCFILIFHLLFLFV